MSVDPQTDDAAPVALTRAADVAGHAPSLENTQPWRWRVEGDSMRLYAEPIRQLTASDPGGRLMVFSCGAALHHARIALAAQGWRINVDRLTEPDRPQLLARVRIVGRTEETQVARRLLRAVHMRQTDPRSVRPTAVERKDIDTIRSAVEAERTSLRILNFAPNAGTLQVYRTQPDVSTPTAWQSAFDYNSDASTQAAPFVLSTTGSWNIRAWITPADASGWTTAPAKLILPLAGGEKATILILDQPTGGVRLLVI